MNGVSGQTEIRMSVTQLICGIGALSGVAFGIAQFTFGSLKDDVADIRKAVTEAQDRNANTHQTATTADGELRTHLVNLTAELRLTNAGLNNLSVSVSGLDGSIKAVDATLASSIKRQEAFERYVAIRLGPLGPQRADMNIPDDWVAATQEIAPVLTTGSNPYVDWYKALGN